MRRRLATIAAGAVLALGLAACGGSGAGGGAGGGAAPASQAPQELLVGVSMPTQTSERWIADGNAVKQQLEQAGYKVNLQFADDDIPTQSQQVDQMITQGADVLIIAAIDGTALSSQLQAAAAAGIPVIAYDRLIRDSENVDFYVTFDNYKVGVAAGHRAARSASASERGRLRGHGHRPVQHRAVRRLAGRQQRALLLRRRDGHPEAAHRRRHAGRQVRPDRPSSRSPSCAGCRRPRRSAWRTCSPRSYNDGTQGRRRALAVRRPLPRHHHRAAERRLRPRRQQPTLCRS